MSQWNVHPPFLLQPTGKLSVNGNYLFEIKYYRSTSWQLFLKFWLFIVCLDSGLGENVSQYNTIFLQYSNLILDEAQLLRFSVSLGSWIGVVLYFSLVCCSYWMWSTMRRRYSTWSGLWQKMVALSYSPQCLPSYLSICSPLSASSSLEMISNWRWTTLQKHSPYQMVRN